MIKFPHFLFIVFALVSSTISFSVKAFPEPGFLVNQTLNTPHIDFNRNLNKTSIKLSAEEIDYFLEVAMGSEFPPTNYVVRKWQGEIRIKVIGTPTAQDINTLVSVINEINVLAEGSIYLRLDVENPNMKIYFVPEGQFQEYESNYQPVNYGFFWTQWNNRQVITSANILITTEGVTQKERLHLIREELTQSLGLMRDSLRYEKSIFYQGWTDVSQYSEIDKVLIKMLYRPEILPGMSRAQVRQVLSGFAYK